MAFAGFSDPHKDPSEDDLKLWMFDNSGPSSDLSIAEARYMIAKVADQFCALVDQEKKSVKEHMSNGTK